MIPSPETEASREPVLATSLQLELVFLLLGGSLAACASSLLSLFVIAVGYSLRIFGRLPPRPVWTDHYALMFFRGHITHTPPRDKWAN